MQISSLLTFAIPGTVLGIGYISAFNTKPLLLTGTAAIIVAAFVFRNMSVSIESGSSTLLQIDRNIPTGDAPAFKAAILLWHSVCVRSRHDGCQYCDLPCFAKMAFGHSQGAGLVRYQQVQRRCCAGGHNDHHHVGGHILHQHCGNADPEAARSQV